MKDWQDQSHMKWHCECYIVIIPKYCCRAIFGNLHHQIGGVLQIGFSRCLLPH